jgi:hypothetical protein
MQVPIAIFLDALFHDPRWLHSLGTAVLTFLGGAVILVGFFALTASSTPPENEEKEGLGGGRNSGEPASIHTRFNSDSASGGGGRVERAWERGMAKLEAELGDIEEDEYEIDDFRNHRGGIGIGGGTGSLSVAATQHRHHSHTNNQGRGGGGLAPLPPEPKFSLD